MQRLFILLSDVEQCTAVFSRLRESGVPERHMHVIAGLGTTIEELPEANVLQKTELLHGIIKGGVVGGAAGLVGGLLVVNFPPAGVIFDNSLLLPLSLAGAFIGAAASSLISSREHNRRLDPYQDALARGEILLLADVPKHEAGDLRQMITDAHPGARIGTHR
ncbi:MAG: DUF1269 domain-containing protein [Sedimenticola sp.]